MRLARLAACSIALAVLLTTASAEAVVVRIHLLKAATGIGSVALERVDASPVRVHCTNTSQEEAFCEVPPRSTWRVVAESRGMWAESKLVTLVESEASVSVSLWRTGDVVGRFARNRGEQAPPSVTVRFGPGRHIGNDQSLPDGNVECPVYDSSFRCEVPAGFLDLRIKARGYIADYRWDAEVPAGAKYDAGEIKLAKGAAVVGRVRVAGRGIKPAASIILTPQLGELADPHTARNAQLSLSAITNDRGFFHVDGVPPGNYVVTARQTGFASARTTVRVLANVESELIEPLSLERPHGVDLAVSPPVDADTHPWRIRLQELGALRAFSPEPLQAKYVAPGLYRIAAISPGSYQVNVENGAGETFFAQAIEVNANQSLIPISLSIVSIKGHLRLGDDPLSAAIWFGGRHGAAALRLDSDAKGSFRGFLPRTGKWLVEVESEEPRVRRVLRDVDIRDPDDGSASLDLRLPATTLKGSVLGPEDVPMAAANVIAKTDDALVQTTSDSTGHFELHGLPEGIVALSATAAGKYSSDSLEISLQHDHTTEVEIRLRESLKVTGLVSSGGMGVPGATVMLWPTHDIFPNIKPVSTAPNGAFSTSVPASTTSVNVIVLAPGFALYARQVDIQTSQNIVCELSQRGASLTIERKSESSSRSQPFLMHDGVPIFAPILSQWIRLHGGGKLSRARLTIADLEPGLYVGCVSDEANSLSAIARGARPAGQCANVTIMPLSEVTMRLP